MHPTKGMFISAISLSALLIFLIEPMAGKVLLPTYGGSASVWSACLLFFTAFLCLGYAYAYVLIQRGNVFQRRMHGVLLVAAALWVCAFPIPVIPVSEPIVSVLLVLSAWLGLPFIALAATGPLLQQWYASVFGEPYHLYSISNLASFAGLFAYPFLLEPAVPLSVDLTLWRVGVVCCFALLALVAWLSSSAHLVVRERVRFPSQWPVYVALAAVPSMLLVVVTTQVTQVIAPVPLLWVVPLALYLLSFVIAFVGRGDTLIVGSLVLLSAAASYALTPPPTGFVPLQALALMAVLFFGALRFHARLYALRPAAPQLGGFYLALALGGAIGTLIPAVLAPAFLNDYWEFPVAFAVAAAGTVYFIDARAPLSRALRIVLGATIITSFCVFVGDNRLASVTEGTISRSRDFYGVLTLSKTPEALALIHGRTLHGLQLSDPAQAQLPTTYYTPASGIGRAVAFLRSEHLGGMRVGVVGLGTGSIASYCTPDDTFSFYEIDPQMVRIAEDDFTYLAHCAGASVVVGDGRISLASSSSTFDLLAIDAFNNDSIPVHLLTREALSVYAKRLAGTRSVVAFHVSNRYLDLEPVVIRLAADSGFASMVIRDDGTSGTVGVPTIWVLLAQDASVFTSPAFRGTDSLPPPPAPRVWTDDYASVWTAVFVPDLRTLPGI